jgi:hypothetical protein
LNAYSLGHDDPKDAGILSTLPRWPPRERRTSIGGHPDILFPRGFKGAIVHIGYSSAVGYSYVVLGN